MERTIVAFNHPKFQWIKSKKNFGIIVEDINTKRKFIVSEAYTPINLERMMHKKDYVFAKPESIKKINIDKLIFGSIEIKKP